MSAHTSGPWVAIWRHPDLAVLGRDESGDPTGEHVASIYGDGTIDNADANARLIAAAPDLYDALREVSILIESGLFKHYEKEPWIDRVRAALAKVEKTL